MAKRKFSMVIRVVSHIWAEAELDTDSAEFKETLADNDGDQEMAIKDALICGDWEVLNEEADDQELVYHEEI
mgnify:CR=1 FL=1